MTADDNDASCKVTEAACSCIKNSLFVFVPLNHPFLFPTVTHKESMLYFKFQADQGCINIFKKFWVGVFLVFLKLLFAQLSWAHLK